MRNTFKFSFDEIPLAIVDGIEAGFINGQAEIEYYRDGEWDVMSVSLEGFGERVDGKRQWPYVPAPAPIADIVCQRLHKEWFDRVCNAVTEQLASDREDAAEMRAEMRRDARMGL